MRKRWLPVLLTLCMIISLLPHGTVIAAGLESNSAAGIEAEPEENLEAATGEGGIMPLTVVDDHTSPVVTGVYMNSPGGTVTVGDKLEFSVSAEDESGIDMNNSRLMFTYICEREHEHTVDVYGDEWYGGSYDESTKQAKFELTITDDMLNGTYKLSHVSIRDTYGNYAAFRPAGTNYPEDPGNPGNIDFDAVCFTVTESSATEDHDPPAVTVVSMEEPGKIVTTGDKLEFSVSAEDDSGIDMNNSRLMFTYICEREHEHTVDVYGDKWYGGSYDESTKQAKFELTITDDMLNGTYKLSHVSIRDTYGNYATFRPAGTNYPEDPGNPGNIDFDAVCFTVTESSATEDHDPPTVTVVSMEEPGKIVTTGDKLEFSVSAEDESGIDMNNSSLMFTYICEQEHEHTVDVYGDKWYGGSYDESTKQAKFELTITDDMLNGTYKLSHVSIRDTYGNYAAFRPAGTNYPGDPGNPGNIDFDAVYFVIATPDIEPESVSIPESISLPVRSTKTIRPTVTPVDCIPDWTWTSADSSIVEVHSAGGGTSCNVTGIAPGVTTITGTTQNGLTATCVVTVTDAPLPESGTINETYNVGVGGYVDIIPVLTPSDATTLYEVSSDNPHVVGIGTTGGHTGIRIEGNNPGTATITIRGANNLLMTTTVKVGSDSDRQHERTTVAGYAPTCARPGRTDSVVCSACWYEFTPATEIPATGEHSYGEWRVVQEATSAASGLKERYCEVCRNRETQTIPATGGTSARPSTPATSGGSGGISSTSQSVNISAGDQSVPVTIKNGTVEMSATKKQISDMITSSTDDGVVEINMSSIGDAKEIYIAQDVVSAVKDSESVSGLSITAKNGSIEMSSDALNTVSTALTGTNDQVSFKIDTLNVDTIPATQKYPIANVLNSAVFIELSANVIHRDDHGRTISTEAIREFNGSVTVSVPYVQPANMDGRQIIACHIADDGTITYFPVKYENGFATFITTHFSTFAVVESRAAAFSDVDISAWYMLSVEYALDNGLMGGYGNGLFAPDSNLSRAMLAQILYNKEQNPDVSGSSSFTDVADGEWYTDAVMWANRNGIVNGYGNGLFGPNDYITREQLAVMLWRYAGQPAATEEGLLFTDSTQASNYALDALHWAVESGILNGYGDGRLNPGGLATRAQAAQMLKNFLEQ